MKKTSTRSAAVAEIADRTAPRILAAKNVKMQATSSQPLMLLLAVVVYDLPTGTVSLCLAVDSARTAVGRSTTPARQSGTRCLMNLEILTVLIVLNGS